MSEIELNLPQPRAYVWLLVLALAIPLLVLGGITLFDHEDAPTLLIWGMGLTPVALITMTLAWAMRRQRAWIDSGVLHVVSTFYHRRIPLAKLDLDAARTVNVREHPEYRPRLRSNGFAVPGMVSGWYRLKGWKKAFAAYGDPSRVLCIDTGDFLLMLGVEHPQSALDRLRRAREGKR